MCRRVCRHSFVYILSITDTLKEIRKPLRILIYVPYAITLVALAVSPLGGYGIFYLDAQNYYWGGGLHFLLYVDVAIYLLTSVVTVIFYKGKIDRKKRDVLVCFVSIIILSGIVQTLLPSYLITTGATALAITAMYYFFQSPAEKLDPLTGLFNRTQLPVILKSMVEQNKPYTLVLFQIRYADEMRRAFGSAATDEVMISFAEMLKKHFSKSIVFCMDVAYFVVFCSTPPTREELQHWQSIKLDLGEGSMMITVRTAMIPDQAKRTVETTLSLTEYLFKKLARGTDAFLYADSGTEKACNAEIWLSTDIENLLQQNETKILFSPCHGRDGEFAGEIVSLHIETADYCFSSAQVAEAVIQKNLIWQYIRRLLEGAAQHRHQYNAQHPAYIPLPVMACLENQTVEKLYRMVLGYGMEPSMIAFSMRESDVASAIPMVLENIGRLVQKGFSFSADHFAADFTDITVLTRLPICTVQIDPYFMVLAEKSDRQKSLLAGLISVFRNLGKRVICGGSSGEAGAQLAFSLGADEWQSTEQWDE